MDPDSTSLFFILFELQGSLLIQFISLFILLIVSGLISGAEVAFFSLTKEHLESEEEQPSRQMELTKKLLNEPKRLLATILITNNFINIAIVLLFALIGEILFSPIGNPLIVLFIEIGLITFLILFFGEILPKVYANRLTTNDITQVVLNTGSDYLVTDLELID